MYPISFTKINNNNYTLDEEYIDIIPFENIFVLQFNKIILYTKGALRIGKGYIWYVPESLNKYPVCSLIYSALITLLKNNVLNKRDKKRIAVCIRDLCISNGLEKIKARYVYWQIRIFGEIKK